jgi:uncharacterized protein YjbJ (UPF0337 family)
MNADLFKGKWDEFKGDLKQEWSKFTDDDLLTIRRGLRQFHGTSPRALPWSKG